MLVLLGGYRISTISRFDTIIRSWQNTLRQHVRRYAERLAGTNDTIQWRSDGNQSNVTVV